MKSICEKMRAMIQKHSLSELNATRIREYPSLKRQPMKKRVSENLRGRVTPRLDVSCASARLHYTRELSGGPVPAASVRDAHLCPSPTCHYFFKQREGSGSNKSWQIHVSRFSLKNIHEKYIKLLSITNIQCL